MASDDFNEFIDELLASAKEGGEALKRAIGPFSALLNPQSSKATQAQIDKLEERVARQDRQIDDLLDRVKIGPLTEALKEQLDRLTAFNHFKEQTSGTDETAD